MARAYIRAGELHGGYEPHDLPGAWIPLRYTVTDSTGTIPSASCSREDIEIGCTDLNADTKAAKAKARQVLA